MKVSIKSFVFLAACFIATVGYSQKGKGDAMGVRRQGLNPELLQMEGTIKEITNDPCEHTTGKSMYGTHFLIRTKDALINMDLGPTSEISQLVTASEGDAIAMTVFRTDKLSHDQYIAKEITVNGKTTVLRDDALKPIWSGKNRKGKMKMGK